MTLGAAEDNVRAPDLVTAKAKMAQLRLAGFTAVRVTSNWLPGSSAPTADELTVLRNVEAAARLSGVKVYVSVYHPGSRTTPLEPAAQAEFAQYAAALAERIPTFDDVIVGNEPNLNRFWLPQFGLDGANASAPAYLSLLARTYDALKAVDPTLRVWGGALAPRGGDRPDGDPADVLPHRLHPGDGRRVPRERPHAARDGRARVPPVPGQLVAEPGLPAPALDVDRARGLRQARRAARGGVRRDGPGRLDAADPLRRVRDRVGRARGQAEPLLGHRADDDEAGRRVEAGGGVRSRPPARVLPADRRGMLLFHSHDETALLSWQSGVYYADGTPKASLWAVRDSLDRTRGGSIARCDGLALDVGLKNVRFPGQRGVPARQARRPLPLHARLRVGARRDADDDGARGARVRGYGR